MRKGAVDVCETIVLTVTRYCPRHPSNGNTLETRVAISTTHDSTASDAIGQNLAYLLETTGHHRIPDFDQECKHRRENLDYACPHC